MEGNQGNHEYIQKLISIRVKKGQIISTAFTLEEPLSQTHLT